MIRNFVRTIIRCEVLQKEHKKILQRTICTSQKSYYQYLDELTDPNDIIVKSKRPFLHIPTITIDQFVWSDVGKFAEYTAIVDGITGREMTYGDLRNKCRVLAIRLQKDFHLKIGDTIGVCMPNCPEYPIPTLAGIEAGMIVTIMNPYNTAVDMAKQLVDSETKMLFGLAKNRQTLEKAVELSKRKILIVYLKESSDEEIPDGSLNFDNLLDSSGIDPLKYPEHPRNYQNIVLLPYSSGTTFKPKGVELTHKNIVSNSLMLNSLGVCEPTTDNWQDVFPCVLPFFHIYGMTLTLISKLALGVKIVTLPGFNPDTFLNAMEKYKGTVLNLVPPHVSFLANSDRVEKKHTESIRYIICGAGPIGKWDVDKLLERIPNAKFIHGYGLTECSPAIFMSSPDNTNHASVGILNANTEAKIAALGDVSFKGLGPNQSGEILVRGPQVMDRYSNDNEATRQIFTREGFLRTGDIGHYDENQEFYVTDRLKELMKVKGFQVSPVELEEIIKCHPSVFDAAVCGIPHKIFGELPRAIVVKKPGQEVTDKEIQDFVADKVAYYKQLEGGVQFVDSIPRHKNGGILRKVLFEKYCNLNK